MRDPAVERHSSRASGNLLSSFKRNPNMSTPTSIELPTSVLAQDNKLKILDQYGCGPIRFAGDDSGLYDRHLLFDNVIDQADACARDRFEAFARSVRDVLSQRWTLTEKT